MAHLNLALEHDVDVKLFWLVLLKLLLYQKEKVLWNRVLTRATAQGQVKYFPLIFNIAWDCHCRANNNLSVLDQSQIDQFF